MSDRSTKWCHNEYHPKDTNFDLPIAISEFRKKYYEYLANDFDVTFADKQITNKQYAKDEALYLMQMSRELSSAVQWANNIPLNADNTCFQLRERAWLQAVRSCAIIKEENLHIKQYLSPGRNTQKYVDLNDVISNIEARIKGLIKSDRDRHYKMLKGKS